MLKQVESHLGRVALRCLTTFNLGFGRIRWAWAVDYNDLQTEANELEMQVNEQMRRAMVGKWRRTASRYKALRPSKMAATHPSALGG